jgi:hypothetical protein
MRTMTWNRTAVILLTFGGLALACGTPENSLPAPATVGGAGTPSNGSGTSAAGRTVNTAPSVGDAPSGEAAGAGGGVMVGGTQSRGGSVNAGGAQLGGTQAGAPSTADVGGSTATGGSTTGGAVAIDGGTSVGGRTTGNGGTVTAGGGTSAGGRATDGSGTGGTGAATGGAARGGAAAAGQATGGSATGSTTGGGSSTCWTGEWTTWTATDYVSRKWARWPIPNPVSTGLPNPMSYTETAEGIQDNVTGLIWQKDTSPSGSDWAGALSYCTGLGAGWSLPTRIELTTVLHHDRAGSKIDTSIFTFGASAGWTWASTPWVVNQRKSLTGAAALSWFINFALGDSNNSLSQTNTGASSRCVRIQPTMTLPAEHYTVSNGEVTDNYTCLVWQQDGSGTTPSHTRDQAIAYCQGLTSGGQTWRLPSLNELASMVDDVPTGDVSPAVDHTIFPNTSPDQKYWSSSGYGAPATLYWMLNFMDGFTQRLDASTLGNVRCVRSAT